MRKQIGSETEKPSIGKKTQKPGTYGTQPKKLKTK
jgi:hypothetical protein